MSSGAVKRNSNNKLLIDSNMIKNAYKKIKWYDLKITPPLTLEVVQDLQNIYLILIDFLHIKMV